MKYQIVLKICNLEKVKEYEDFKLASNEFEVLKRMNADVRFISDGKDISETFSVKPFEDVSEENKTSEKVDIDCFFCWKEGETKKSIKVKESRANVLLNRAENAGYKAYIIDMAKRLIAKVNC